MEVYGDQVSYEADIAEYSFYSVENSVLNTISASSIIKLSPN